MKSHLPPVLFFRESVQDVFFLQLCVFCVYKRTHRALGEPQEEKSQFSPTCRLFVCFAFLVPCACISSSCTTTSISVPRKVKKNKKQNRPTPWVHFLLLSCSARQLHREALMTSLWIWPSVHGVFVKMLKTQHPPTPLKKRKKKKKWQHHLLSF